MHLQGSQEDHSDPTEFGSEDVANGVTLHWNVVAVVAYTSRREYYIIIIILIQRLPKITCSE